jgi:type IV secretion system protein VirB9
MKKLVSVLALSLALTVEVGIQAVHAESMKTQEAIQHNQSLYQSSGTAGIIVRPTNIRYPYGEGNPTFYCAVMEVCEISFLPNDRPVIKLLGDSLDWPSGWWVGQTPNGPVYHMALKPYPSANKTNVVIGMENDRTYMFNLEVVPSERLRVHSYSFYDPGQWAQPLNFPNVANPYQTIVQEKNKVERLQEKLAEAHKKLVAAGHALSIDPTAIESFYKIKGSAPWKPVAVFDDGHRVFIQFPPNVGRYFRPEFSLLSKENKLWTTNFERASNTMIVVPHLFKRGALVWGRGADKQEIKIYRLKAKKKKSWFNPF